MEHETVSRKRSVKAWLGFERDPVPISWMYTARAWLLFMPAYAVATGVWLYLDRLHSDVYATWWIGPWAAAFTIALTQVGAAKAGNGRYWGAFLLLAGINFAGIKFVNSELRGHLDLLPRLAYGVGVSTVAIIVAIAIVQLTMRRPSSRPAAPAVTAAIGPTDAS